MTTMTNIENYYDLPRDINRSNCKVTLLFKHPDQMAELKKEQEANESMQVKLEVLKKTLSEESEDADCIRVAFIQVSAIVLKRLAEIKYRSSSYPDLSQTTIIPGNLFLKILDYYYAALCAGCLPDMEEIYVTSKEWDNEPLRLTLVKIEGELIEANFTSKIEAIEFYEYIRTAILIIRDDLAKRGIIKGIRVDC